MNDDALFIVLLGVAVFVAAWFTLHTDPIEDDREFATFTTSAPLESSMREREGAARPTSGAVLGTVAAPPLHSPPSSDTAGASPHAAAAPSP